MKSLWQLHPEQAPVVREIIVDLYTNRKMSYLQIRDELNSRGIPNASGGLWSPTSITEMLKPHRLEQYAGTGFWNKAVTRDTVGTKYKPREEWITVENAHPAIITTDELDAALTRKREGRQAAPYGRTRESRHLLTGQNFEGQPMFTCAVCGANVIGYANNRVNWRNYVCGAHRTKGDLACTNDWRVNADWLEQRIVDEITTRFTTPQRVDELVNGIASSLRTKNRDVERQITALEKEHRETDTQISRLMDAIKSGVDASLIATEINAVKQKKDDLESQVKTLRSSIREESKVDTQALRAFFTNFPAAYKAATIQEKRDLIRTFVRHITLVPETKEIRLELYPDNTVQSIGGGDPWHCKTTTSTITCLRPGRGLTDGRSFWARVCWCRQPVNR